MEKGITIELDFRSTLSSTEIIFKKSFSRIRELIENFEKDIGRYPEYINIVFFNNKKYCDIWGIPVYTNKKEEKVMDEKGRSITQPEVRDKPYDLIEEITNLDTAITEIRRLIEKVTNECSAKNEGNEIKKQVFNSLVDLLEKGPNEIQKFKVEMSKCIHELDELLFKKGRKI